MFKFDPKKSALNKRKHGIDFEHAQALWKDGNHVMLPAKDRNEPRYMVIGLINGKHWTAIATQRNNKVRLISVRRSRFNEVDFYENQIAQNNRFDA